MRKYLKLSLLLFFIPLLVHTSIPVERLVFKKDKNAKGILRNIRSVPFGGLPGNLVVFGKRASVVLTAKNKSPVIALSHFGKGKAVALSHYSFLSKAIIRTKNGGALLGNLTRLNKTRNKSILCVGNHELYKHLSKTNSNVTYEKKLPDNIQEYGIVFMRIPHGHDAAFRDEQIKRLKRYVHKGGTLIGSAIGWVFIHYGEGKKGKDLHDFYGNKLFEPMGIAWGSGYAGGRNNKYQVRESVGNRAHIAIQVNRAITKINSGVPSKNHSRTQAEINALYQALDYFPDIKTLLTPRQIKALMSEFSKRTKTIIPTKNRPISITDNKNSYLLVFANAIMKKQADPGGSSSTIPGLAEDFPGPLAAGARAKTKEIVIQTGQSRWFSTGLYAAPGALVTVHTRQHSRKLGVQIGAHADKLFNKKKWRRWPDIVTRKKIRRTKTVIQNPHGGLVYVTTRAQRAKKTITLRIQGAITAPYFKLGRTKLSHWKRMLKRSKAPWGEIASEKIVITVPTSSLRKLEDPRKILRFWDRVIGYMDELGANRESRGPERFVCDRQIIAGYMVAGYPIRTHMDVRNFVLGLDGGKIYKEGSWGHFHELGHLRQKSQWTFSGTGEVTVNLFTLYAMDKMLGFTPHKHPWVQGQYKRAKQYLREGQPFRKWKKDPGLALVMYVQLQRKFGWRPFKKLFAEYAKQPKTKSPKTDADKRDQWMLRFSEEVGYNLGPFFKMWRIPVSNKALNSIKNLPIWMPEPL